jgi:uncharacterized membrane protein YeaQ/YmgE (transglycosylase-associated protein family)
MMFVGGLVVWVVLGVVGAFVVRALYRAEGTESWLTFVFGFFGAMIGGMLGTSAYIHHDPVPLRPGGLLGAALGAAGFVFLYHFIARKATP